MALSQLKIQELLDNDREHECDGCGENHICVSIASIAELPTRFGDFHIVAFYNNKDGKEHAAIVKGDITDAEDVPVRIHSECLTGDALGSLRCDCRDQLEAALTAIGKMEKGMVLYLRQEGRGIGFINKIRAYGLQDYGMDTVEANLALGFRDDERDYEVAAHMLMSLQVKSIQLMTNNPKKMNDMTKYGIKVSGRIPHILPPNAHNEFYLRTKAEKSGHLIDFSGKEHLMEQIDRPVVKGMSPDQINSLHE
ncbi:MAG: GTP cyclohydrolase II [Anaerolineales bacterium]|jgi:GTP cyclohydrolase II|nr:GTP cyclohydrolase II [Anaerolineales bacterium]